MFLSGFFLFFIHSNGQVQDSTKVHSKDQGYFVSETEIYIYKKPRFFDIITKLPKNVAGTFRDMGQKNNLIALGISGLATLVILPFDQSLVDRSRRLGESIGMEEVARYKSFGPLSNIPPNLTSAIYLIGNGTTPILLSIGFASFGFMKNDYRSLHTASGLVESLIVSGVYSQTIKRISGRQSPAPAIEDGNRGGSWNPFPSFGAYGRNTPNYDAFPSGHVMTATSALYVIMENYPEVKWIRPVGFSLIGLLGFQMVQSEVHWVSDYPLAFVMGYIIGKNIANRRVKKINLEEDGITPKKYSFNLNSSRNSISNMIGITVTF